MAVLETLMFLLAGVWQGFRQDFNLLEIAVVALLAARGVPHVSVFQRLGRAIGAISRRRVSACVLAGMLAILLRLALIPLMREPVPVVSDEFSHLLLADTLLHGRLVNATHPFWPHFESLHIIQQPQYVSNYFPGHAMVLALAIWMVGDPWFGILALSGVFCGTLCWALQGWMPARWAFPGALLALLRFSIGSYWINAFHGGFLPAIGGALVVGAFARLRDGRFSAVNASAFSAGLAILAATRPMEGLACSLPFLLALPFWRWRLLVPLALITGTTLGGLGFYCYRVTGTPFSTAYNVSQKIYGWPVSIAWLTPQSVHHRHIEMERYYRYELDEHAKVNSIPHFLKFLTFRVQEYWRFYLGPALSVPLAMLAWVWRKRRLRVAFVALGTAFGAVMLEGAASPHYLAPATVIIWLLLMECFRHLSATRSGLALARVLPCVLILVLALRIGAENLHLPYTQALNYQSWCCKQPGNYEKERITEYLTRQPGLHLAFVLAKTDENNLLQWIYNSAEIDQARIVWARDLGPEENRKLADYFHARQVWMINPNVQPAEISPYLGERLQAKDHKSALGGPFGNPVPNHRRLPAR